MISFRLTTRIFQLNAKCLPLVNQKLKSTKCPEPRYDLKDRVVLVTGGATGIGKAVTEALLKNEIKGITIADFNEKEGAKTAECLAECYGEDKVQFVKCDVLCDDHIEAAFEQTVKCFNQLDIVFNNAGIFDESQPKRTIDINLAAVIVGTHLAIEKYLPKYRSCKEGVVINCASILGHTTIPIGAAYCCTKHALIGLAKCYAVPSEYKKTSCRVMNLCPGFTTTPLLGHDLFRLRPQHEEEAKAMMPRIDMQEVEVVADTVVHMIKYGDPGSHWIISRNKMEAAKVKEAFDIKAVFNEC